MADETVAKEATITIPRNFYEVLVQTFLRELRIEATEEVLSWLFNDLPQREDGFSEEDVDFFVECAMKQRRRDLAGLIAQQLRREPGPHGGLEFIEVMKFAIR